LKETEETETACFLLKEIFRIKAFERTEKEKNSLSNLKEDAQRVFFISEERMCSLVNF